MEPYPDERRDVQEGLLSGVHKAPAASFCWLQRKTLKRILLMVVVLSLIVILVARPTSQHPRSKGELPPNIKHLWAQYSPYIAQEEYIHLPAGCRITQVHILQRHGARYPTTGATKTILNALSKVQRAERYDDPRLRFLETFVYNLGSNDLLQFGADQSFDSGTEIYQRYSSLVDEYNLPFVRASSGERVVLSATNWTAGFAAASNQMYRPPLSVILSEAGNNTLDDKMCPAAGDEDAQTEKWLLSYAPPITAYLNNAAPGANLTDADTFALISLCPFDSYDKGRKSDFCGIFEDIPGTFEGFTYSGDLNKYYGTGYGQRLGPVQGVGYINELIARLTTSSVRDHTQTNRTLDSSPETFPLNKTIYADFSHDNEMIAVYAAMGLFKQPEVEPLDLGQPDENRVWRVAEMVPFSGRMVVEKLECRNQDLGENVEVAVRILVNDRVQPLQFCNANADRICELNAFVDSQQYARNDGNGDWDQCF